MNNDEVFLIKTVIGGAVLYSWAALVVLVVLIVVTISCIIEAVYRKSKENEDDQSE